MLGASASGSASPPRGSMPAPLGLVVLVVMLFFVWGGVTSLNDILIPKLKGLFALSYTQAMFTQFAFFTAYAIISLPAGLLIARLGYGLGIVVGLGVMASGSLLFVPAAAHASYPMFLAALFVLAAGITTLQVAANPLIANLGPADSSHSRLTFAQAFNSLGTTIWPFAGAHLILGSISKVDPSTLSGRALAAFQAREAAVIGHTYIGVACGLAVIAIAFLVWRRRLGAAEPAASLTGGLSLLRQPRLRGGMIALFLYVGAEVAIGSLMVNFLTQPSVLGISQRRAGELLALYWGGAMIGRFIGAGLLRMVSPGRLLAAVALGALCLVGAASLAGGTIAGCALLAVGLMNSIMFPTIFSLALEGLGERTAQASGLLCMGIVGGAFIPMLVGAVADATALGFALAIPAACYLYIAYFGSMAARAPRHG